MNMGDTGSESLNALATKALNPVAKMISVPFQNNLNYGVGPDDDTQYVLDIQPVVPFTLSENWNLITRTIIPIVSQRAAGPDQSSKDGLGDINSTLWLSPAAGHDLFWGVGPTFTVPSGSSKELTSGQWSLGPSAVLMWTPGRWMVGAVANQQWSVAGWRDQNVSASYIQPMVVYHLPDGWYLASVPVITADWKADSGDVWTVPVGGGAGKVLKIGHQAMNLQLQAFYNVEKPSAGPDWQLRFQFQFIFPK
ncbi:MAG: transporter [Pseudomonadales bacterium]|nr:transporter [Pseudomonadales bacterium]